MSFPQAAELPARRAVWRALSALDLDTDTDAFLPHVAQVLAASPYAEDRLWRILRDEVHPVLHANLLAVAGEWAGFDEDWLAARILRRLARPHWARPFGCVLCGHPRRQWRILRPLIAQARQAARDDAVG